MRYLKTFNDMSGADPFIWGGNLNTGLIQLAALLRTVDPRYLITDRDTSSAEQPGITQVVFSHPLRYTHGDIALTCGLRAAQVNSEVGRFYSGASADHDLVVAKVFVPASVTGTTDASHSPDRWNSAMSPPPEGGDSGTEISSDSASRAPQKRRSSSRAAQPVVLTARPLPRIIKLFASDENRDLQNVLENISQQYMWGKLSRVLATTTGCWDMAVPLPAVEKL